MAQVYNEKGSLGDLISKINDKEIRSLKDIIIFKKTLQDKKKKVIGKHKVKVNSEILNIKKEIDDIKDGNILQRIKARFLQRKLLKLRNNFDYFVKVKAKEDLNRLERIDRIIVNNRLSIYGAIGELKVIKELKELSNNFYVLNNYKIRFNKAIYNRQTDDYIQSIQVDHVVVGPTGFFIIEKKNWSDKTVKRKDLFSPVRQVERMGFAMFVWLNSAIREGIIIFSGSFWGSKKISPQKIITLVKAKHYEKLQYTNILPLDKLVSYIQKRKNVFSEKEVKEIANYLLKRL